MAHRSIQRITSVITAGSPTNLTSLANVKLELAVGADDTQNDGWFNLVLPQITGTIQAYCNRIFANQVYLDAFRIRRPSGALSVEGGADPLVLANIPVVSIIDIFDMTGAPAIAPPNIATPNPVTTLSAPMTAGQTTMQVIQPLGTAYPFDVLLDTGAAQEVVTVLSLSGSAYNVTRGAAGTTAVAHAANDPAVQAMDPTLFEFEPVTGFVTRLDTDGAGNYWVRPWGTGQIAVFYLAGFNLPGETGAPAGVPALPSELEEAALRLVTMRFKGRGRDPLLRIQGEPGLGQQTFWVGATPGQVGSIPPEIVGLLEQYRIVPI